MKLIRLLLRPVAFLMVVGTFVVTRSLKDAFAEASKDDAAKMPEVVVSGNQDSRKKNYKPSKVSSSKYTGPLRDIPQTINVIPEAVLKDQNAVTLREALRNVPGVTIQAGEGGVPAGDNLSIRGFNARTDIFTDGVRDFGGYTRDPFNMSALEVTKGPTSAYAGRGSTGGSVNQVSKTPQMQRFFKGGVSAGTGYYKRTTIDMNEPIALSGIPGMAFRLNGMLHDADIEGRDKGENKRVGIAPSLALGLGTPLRAVISYFYMGQDNQPDYGIPWVPLANATGPLAGYGEQPAPVDWSNYYGTESRDYEHIQTHMVTGKIEYDLNDDMSIRNQLRYGNSDRDSIITAPRFVTGSSNLINRQMQSRLQNDAILNNQTDVTSKFETGFAGHTLITGVEYQRENDDNRPRSGPAQAAADLFNPQFDDPYEGPLSVSDSQNETTADSFGLYSFDTIALHEKLDLIGGLRWDYFSVLFEPAEGGASLQRIDRKFSWRGGVVYKPYEIGSFYFGYGTSFNPAAEGLSLSSAANAAANLSLAPEKNSTFEVGTKWDVLEEKLQLTGALYRTDKNNARTADPGNNLASTADDVVVLQGKQRVLGGEIGLAGNITDKWRAYGGYSLIKSETISTLTVIDQGKNLINTPAQQFNLFTVYELPLNFEIGGGVNFTGPRYANTSNSRKAPEYWTFDMMAAYKLSKNITFRLNATNITDQEYIGTIGGGHFTPGPGRAIIGSTDFEF